MQFFRDLRNLFITEDTRTEDNKLLEEIEKQIIENPDGGTLRLGHLNRLPASLMPKIIAALNQAPTITVIDFTPRDGLVGYLLGKEFYGVKQTIEAIKEARYITTLKLNGNSLLSRFEFRQAQLWVTLEGSSITTIDLSNNNMYFSTNYHVLEAMFDSFKNTNITKLIFSNNPLSGSPYGEKVVIKAFPALMRIPAMSITHTYDVDQ